ncbi:16S rRNA (adenine(1518)-N(6)/adenine(1519)-N(6))-dimethyltransferase RsmA, partial [Candidatus Parcubacteria bacterium]|nr:16S rRNA (adenine(1518)-N(6)/adenine(1519)-N(6))-dimethyltransferase RsmA [Candidatus Parcubacteria bacterium]
MHIHAKKSLGQNFLKSRSVVFKMLEAAKVTAEDTVVEIGPGKGILTRALVEKAGRVIAIEKDDRLIEYLQNEFRDAIEKGQLTLIHGDILDLNLESLKLKARSYKLIANIPYYITGQFLRKFLEAKLQPTVAVVMLQKEVTDRIIARDGKESILSMSVKAYGRPSKVAKVPAKFFSPPPNVDSAILL